MKDAKMLIWLMQLGLSVSLPPAGFLFLALWLRSRYGWGNWVIWAGAVLGIFGGVTSFRSSLKVMEQMSEDKEKSPPPQSFHEHD